MEGRRFEEKESAPSMVDFIRKHIVEIAVVTVACGFGGHYLLDGWGKNKATIDSMKTYRVKEGIDARRTELYRQLSSLDYIDENGSLAAEIALAEKQIAACGEGISHAALQCLKEVKLPEKDNDGR